MSLPLHIAHALYSMQRFAERWRRPDMASMIFLAPNAVLDIATELLEVDTAGPSTIELATSGELSWRDIGNRFELMLQEHGIQGILDGDGAVMVVELDVADRILQGESAFFGVREAWQFLNEHWEHLRSPTFGTLSFPADLRDSPELTTEIREKAMKFIEAHRAQSIPSGGTGGA